MMTTLAFNELNKMLFKLGLPARSIFSFRSEFDETLPHSFYCCKELLSLLMSYHSQHRVLIFGLLENPKEHTIINNLLLIFKVNL